MKKRITAGILAMCMAASLAACGSSGSAGESESGAESALGTEETSDETAEGESETEKEQAYAFDYDINKLVKLGDYKGLTYTIVDTTVSDQEVTDTINQQLQASATVEQIKDRAVADKDTVNIDYEGKIDGKTFDDGSATDTSLTIGSNQFIDGFEKGLIGHKPGEKVTLNLKFPDDYSTKDLAGKDVQFVVTINYINGKSIVPELDDKFVASQKIDNVTTVAQYKKYIKEQLESQKKSQADNSKQQELTQKAVDNAEIKNYPQEMVDQYAEQYKSQYEQYAAYYGMELSDFLKQYMQTTEDDFNKQAEEYGKQATSFMLVMYAIADAENFQVDDKLYQEKLAEYAEENGFDSADDLEKQYGRKYITQVIINDKAIAILEKNAKGVKAEETESSTEAASETNK